MTQQIYLYNDYRGGEAAIFPATKWNPKYSELLKNLCLSERGGITSVDGYEAKNQTHCGAELNSGYVYKKSDGTEQVLAAGDGKIYMLGEYVYLIGFDSIMELDNVVDFDNIGQGETRGAWNELALIHSGLDPTGKIYFSQIQDKVIISNGKDFPLKWDGSKMERLGSVFAEDFDSIKFFDFIDDFDEMHLQFDIPRTFWKTHVHANRLWALDMADRMMIYHSALKYPDDFSSENDAGYLDMKFVMKQGDQSVDIATYIDTLILFFSSHIAIYAGTNPTAEGDFRMAQLLDGVGAITDSVQSVGSDITFLSLSGVKTLRQIVTTGAMNVENVSAAIDPVLTPTTSTFSKVASAHYPNRSWLMLKIDNIIWIYSYVFKAWSRIEGADCSGMFQSNDGRVYFAGNGFLYEYGKGTTFAGKDISWQWNTAHLLLGKGLKAYPKIMNILSLSSTEQAEVKIQLMYDYNPSAPEHYISFKTQAVVQGIEYDFDSVIDVDGISDFDGVLEVARREYADIRLPMFGGGRTLQMKISGSKSAEINNMLIQYARGGV